MRELLRIGGMNVYDLLRSIFESPLLKGALAFDAVLGTNFGPRSPGTVLTLLYRFAAESGGRRAGSRSRKAAWARCAMRSPRPPRRRRELRTERRCAHPGRADRAAASCSSPASDRARTVISSADPKTTFLRLLGAAHLDTGFVRRVTHLRSRGSRRQAALGA
jgi:hypothetical protein